MSSEEFRLVSPTIDNEGKLPRKYTKGGQGVKKNISPPLEWYNVPQGTKSLALVVEDIDAPDPSGPLVPWTVWVVVDVPPDMKGLPEGFSGNDEQVAGIREGNNDHKIPGWRGPLMPSHGHRFQFKLFALNDKPNLGHTVTKERLLDAVDGIVLGEAVFTHVLLEYIRSLHVFVCCVATS